MNLAGDDARPLAEQVADVLRGRIARGELQPGDRLAPERALRDEFQVSRDTIRRVVATLTNEGLLTAGKGRQGRRVRAYRHTVWTAYDCDPGSRRADTCPPAELDTWAQAVVAQGRQPRQEVEVDVVPAPPEIAAQLGVPEGEPVVVRRRLRFSDDEPLQIADSFYPRDVAEGTPIMQPGDIVLPGGLMAHVGHEMVLHDNLISARLPTHAESTRLNLQPSTPVFEYVRTSYDKAMRPVRVIVIVLPGDRNKIRERVPAK